MFCAVFCRLPRMKFQWFKMRQIQRLLPPLPRHRLLCSLFLLFFFLFLLLILIFLLLLLPFFLLFFSSSCLSSSPSASLSSAVVSSASSSCPISIDDDEAFARKLQAEDNGHACRRAADQATVDADEAFARQLSAKLNGPEAGSDDQEDVQVLSHETRKVCPLFFCLRTLLPDFQFSLFFHSPASDQPVIRMTITHKILTSRRMTMKAKHRFLLFNFVRPAAAASTKGKSRTLKKKMKKCQRRKRNG